MQVTSTPITVSPFLRTASPFTSVANPFVPQIGSRDVASTTPQYRASGHSVGDESKSVSSSTPIARVEPVENLDQQHAPASNPESAQTTAPTVVSLEPAVPVTDRPSIGPDAVPPSTNISSAAIEEPSEEIDLENVYLVKNAQLEALNQKLQHENDVLKVEAYETKLALDRQCKRGDSLQHQLAEAQNALKQREQQKAQHDSIEHSNGDVAIDRLALRLQKAERALEQERQTTQNLKKQLELAHRRVVLTSNGGAALSGEPTPLHGTAAEDMDPSCTSASSTPQNSLPNIFEDSSELRAELQAVKSQLLVRTVDVERLKKIQADAEDTIQHLRDQLVGFMHASKMTVAEEEALKQKLKNLQLENQRLVLQEEKWRLKAMATDDRAKAYDAVGCDLQRKCEAASATVGRLIEDNSELVNKLNGQSNLVAELQKEVRLQAAGIRTLEQLLMSYRSGGSTQPVMMPALSALDSEQEDKWKLSMLREEVGKLEIELNAERVNRKKMESQLAASDKVVQSLDGANASTGAHGESAEAGAGASDQASQSTLVDHEPESPFHPPGAEPSSAILEHTESMDDLAAPQSPGSQIHALARKLFHLDEQLESERLQIRLISTQLQGGGGAGPAAAQLKAVQDAISEGQGLPSLPPVAGPLSGRPYSSSAAPQSWSGKQGSFQTKTTSVAPALNDLESIDDLGGLPTHSGKKQRVGFWSWLTGAGSPVEVLPF